MQLVHLQVKKLQNGRIKILRKKKASNYQRIADLIKC